MSYKNYHYINVGEPQGSLRFKRRKNDRNKDLAKI